MDVNAALEVGIGLVIMYLLLALLCTVFTEIISTVLGWRAKNLREGIEKLLDDPNFASLKKDFFALPVISKAYAMSGRHGPSYLASKQFASGLLDYLGKGAWPIGQGSVTAADIEKAIAALPPSATQRLLANFAAEAGGKAEDFRLRIAQWYDDAMERWGGNFKRKTQLWSFCIAALIVVGVNADTFHVGVILWHDPTARAAVVKLADQVNPEEKRYAELKDLLRPFPLGWGAPAPANSGDEGGLFPIVIKILGLAVSAFAVSLGAPFWFQILNKLNAIRGSGRKPAPAESA